MKQILFALVVIVIIIGIMLTGCERNQAGPGDGIEPISGLIYALDGNTILVVSGITNANIPREDWFEAGKRAVYFTITDDTVVELEGASVSKDRLARGQKVDVFHEGYLAESYPEQGGALRIVIVDDTAAEEFRTDSGRYVGLTADNMVEIKISSVPDELPGKLFNLKDEAVEHLRRLELEAEEVILFHYLPDENSEGIIFDLSRITN